MPVSSFPIACPTTQFAEAQFDVMRRQAGGVIGSGRDWVVDRGIPQWKATLKTRPLFLSEVGQWNAFYAAVRGGSRFFTLWDPATEYPQAYMPAGWGALTRATLGSAFDGHCSLGAISASGLSGVGRDVITLGAPYALPTGLHLIGGDKIELRQGVNLLSSPDFTSWLHTDCTLTQNAAVGPDGTATAAVVSRTATGNDFVGDAVTMAGQGLWFRFVAWLKLGTMTGTIALRLRDGSGSTDYAMAPMTVTASWQRFELVGQVPLTAATGVNVYVDPTNDTGSAGDTFQIWKPRLTQVDLETISLHRVLDPSQLAADVNGNLSTWIEPEVPSSFTTEALANLYRARGKFRMSDFQLPVQASGRNRPGQATFTAVSTLN